MLGLGKQRSKLGKWLDMKRISQIELSKSSGVSNATVGRLCSNDGFKPNLKTANKIIRTLCQWDYEVSIEDFWGV